MCAQFGISLQFSHCVSLSKEQLLISYLPVEHVEHVEQLSCPSLSENVLLSHEMQETIPLVGPYLPIGQEIHLDEPLSGENVLVGHIHAR